MALEGPDLTRQPPRSARVRLGGYVILARMLDKGRAAIAGKLGDYKFACPLDQQFLSFVGIDPEALKKELATGKGDGEILDWIVANAAHKRLPAEIEAWSAHQERRAPTDLDSRSYFGELLRGAGPNRTDIASWFDLLDLDDFVSYGGKA